MAGRARQRGRAANLVSSRPVRAAVRLLTNHGGLGEIDPRRAAPIRGRPERPRHDGAFGVVEKQVVVNHTDAALHVLEGVPRECAPGGAGRGVSQVSLPATVSCCPDLEA